MTNRIVSVDSVSLKFPVAVRQVLTFPSSTVFTWTAGRVSRVVEDGVTTDYTYNADGTVATDTRNGVTRTYTWSNGTVTGAGSFDPVSYSLLNRSRVPRVVTVASSSTPTPAADVTDLYVVTALAVAATFGAPTGVVFDGQRLRIRVVDNGTIRALSWNAVYRGGSVALPTATVVGKTLYVEFIWNAVSAKWDIVSAITVP
jgi:hypothetical protein